MLAGGGGGAFDAKTEMQPPPPPTQGGRQEDRRRALHFKNVSTQSVMTFSVPHTSLGREYVNYIGMRTKMEARSEGTLAASSPLERKVAIGPRGLICPRLYQNIH